MKKKNKKIRRMIGALLLFVPGLYILTQLYIIESHTYKTETAISYTMSDSVLCDGVVLFEGKDIPGTGNLGYLVNDGERVSAGAQVAELYTDSAQATCREQLSQLEAQINLLEKSQNANGSDLDMLVSQMQAALYDLLDLMDLQQYDDMKSGEQEYLLAANRLQISTGQASDFSAALEQLEVRREAVLAQLGSPEGIYAPTNGYFTSSASARYLNYDAAVLAGTTPSSLNSLLKSDIEAQSRGMAGRIVTNYEWLYYGVCSLEESAKFEGVTSVQISFPGKAETPLPATVREVVTDTESGLAKITIACEYISPEVLALGHQTAKIDLVTYEGIRISANALHIVNDQKGVYVKYGNFARFRKISVLYQNDRYILVPKNGAEGTENEVRLYDEVIVEGRNLSDAKLL